MFRIFAIFDTFRIFFFYEVVFNMFWDTALKILWHMICIGTNPVQVQFHLAQYFIWAQFYLSLLPQVRFTVTAMVCADFSLQWRHNEHDGVSNHQHHHCLLNRLFKAQIKENTKAPRQWPLCEEIHRCPVNSPHKGPVTRKCFHLMTSSCSISTCMRLILESCCIHLEGRATYGNPVSPESSGSLWPTSDF